MADQPTQPLAGNPHLSDAKNDMPFLDLLITRLCDEFKLLTIDKHNILLGQLKMALWLSSLLIGAGGFSIFRMNLIDEAPTTIHIAGLILILSTAIVAAITFFSATLSLRKMRNLSTIKVRIPYTELLRPLKDDTVGLTDIAATKRNFVLGLENTLQIVWNEHIVIERNIKFLYSELIIAVALSMGGFGCLLCLP